MERQRYRELVGRVVPIVLPPEEVSDHPDHGEMRFITIVGWSGDERGGDGGWLQVVRIDADAPVASWGAVEDMSVEAFQWAQRGVIDRPHDPRHTIGLWPELEAHWSAYRTAMSRAKSVYAARNKDIPAPVRVAVHLDGASEEATPALTASLVAER
jgi:hypothetical protein